MRSLPKNSTLSAYFCQRGVLAIFIVLLVLVSETSAAELSGAANVLKQIEQLMSGEQPATEAQSIPLTPEAPDENGIDPIRAEQFTQLQKAIDEFAVRQPTLTAKQAAEAWLALFDQFWEFALSSPEYSYSYFKYLSSSQSFSVAALIKILPGPEAWEHLTELVENRPNTDNAERIKATSLRLLMYFLTGKPAQLMQELEKIEADVATWEAPWQEYGQQAFGNLKTTVLQLFETDVTKAPLEKLQNQIAECQRTKMYGCNVNVPELLPLIPEAQVRQILEQALTVPGLEIFVRDGEQTRKLAQRIVMENMDRLQTPQWGLVNSIDAVALYEALQRKFPTSQKENSDETSLRRDAQGYYIVGLIARNRTSEALQAALAVPDNNRLVIEVGEIWEQADLAARVCDFLQTVLAQRPDFFFLWSRYGSLAPRVGKTEQMLQTLKQALTVTTLDGKQRLIIQKELINAYIETDQIVHAVRLLREAVNTDVSQETRETQKEFEDQRFFWGRTLVKLGELLPQPDLIEEGLQAMGNALEKQLASDPRGRMTSLDSEFLALLLAHGKYAEAETYVLYTITQKTQQLKKIPPEAQPRYLQQLQSEGFSKELSQLVRIYSQAGRDADIVLLLEQAPWWGTTDLLTLKEIQVFAAKALHTVGRDREAAAILKYFLSQSPREDTAYKLLTAIVGVDLIPWLDECYTRDRFEERPLIWKAVLLLNANRLAEAENIAREAIRIDPTDGEQRAGQRIFSYTVLADILSAMGKPDEAASLRQVVEAVRTAEEGDQLNEEGLRNRSLALYEKAQGIFADAYCIQWRLAKLFYATGQPAAARQHYQTAFAKMPEQFGRVASFCFGCEKAFETQYRRSIGEEVLTRLEKTTPSKPQVHFLLGALRKAQGRYQDAYDTFRRAVALDPEYLDAWNELYLLRKNLPLTRAESDAIIFRMLKLDPRQKHCEGNLSEISDLKGLWTILQANQQYVMTTPETLFVLTASKQQREKIGALDDERDLFGWEGGIPQPGDVLARHDFVQQIGEYISFAIFGAP